MAEVRIFLREMVSLRLLQSKACSYWIGMTGANAEKFRRHAKYSGAMEADGVLECFLSSVIKRQIRNLTYFETVTQNHIKMLSTQTPYPSYEIVKAECFWPCTKNVLERGYGNIKTECKELMPESFYADKKDKKTEKAYVFT